MRRRRCFWPQPPSNGWSLWLPRTRIRKSVASPARMVVGATTCPQELHTSTTRGLLRLLCGKEASGTGLTRHRFVVGFSLPIGPNLTPGLSKVVRSLRLVGCRARFQVVADRDGGDGEPGCSRWYGCARQGDQGHKIGHRSPPPTFWTRESFAPPRLGMVCGPPWPLRTPEFDKFRSGWGPGFGPSPSLPGKVPQLSGHLG